MNMKTFFALWIAVLLATHDVIAHAEDTSEAMASPYYDQALLYVPLGADITEIIPTRATLTRATQIIYIKFDFKEQCYLGYVVNNNFELTVIPCG